MKEEITAQQGDVLIKTTKIPKGLEKVEDPVLQHGEATGHAHRLQMFKHDTGTGSWTVYKDKEGIRFLKVETPTDLTHEEHNTITIPPGEYKIGIVQEYDHFAEEARNVVD